MHRLDAAEGLTCRHGHHCPSGCVLGGARLTIAASWRPGKGRGKSQWVSSGTARPPEWAMLTVISELMLPEPYANGGSVVELSTILGSLAIIFIKSILGA